MFLLKALDNGTMMTVKNAVAGYALPARAAYVEMLRVLRDVSNISVMRQTIELLEMRATGVDDAKETIRQQFLRYKRLETAGLRLPEMLMNALLLFAMPQDLATVRTKFLDTTLSYAELRTQVELHVTAEQTTPTTTAAALTAQAEVLARVENLERQNKQLRQELQDQRNDPRPRCTLPGHGKHAAEECWTRHPEKMPESIRRRRGRRQPSGETAANLDDFNFALEDTHDVLLKLETHTPLPVQHVDVRDNSRYKLLRVDSGATRTAVKSTNSLINVRAARAGHTVGTAGN